MNKTVTLSEEEIAVLNKIREYLTDEEIDRFFPKFRDVVAKANGGQTENIKPPRPNPRTVQEPDKTEPVKTPKHTEKNFGH